MNLISLEFAAFVVLAAILFHASPLRYRPVLLCAVSILFCGLNDMASAAALAAASTIAYYTARRIDETRDDGRRRLLLAASMAVILAHLVLIKLAPHTRFWGADGRFADMLAAFGASYYTLKLIGYMMDVFWRRHPAWGKPLEFGAFASFFPLLPAGPIQRANEFILPTDNSRIADCMICGLRRILLGLVKKLLVADRLGGLVDYIGSGQHSNAIWVMAYVFPIQLYADFSALTDIGIGVSAVFGIRAPENFAFPFFAPSIGEFWRRWHMSLTRWLGDYVFMPLRMATRTWGTVGLAVSIVLNMALIGMWHAISFGWLLFGLINAAYLIADTLTLRHRRRLFGSRPWMAAAAAVIGPVLVFHLIAFSLVCFRAQTPSEIAYWFGNLCDGLSSPVAALRQLFYSYGRGPCAYDFGALCAFALLEGGLYLRASRWAALASVPCYAELPRAIRWLGYYLALLMIGIASQQGSRFIYLQF